MLIGLPSPIASFSRSTPHFLLGIPFLVAILSMPHYLPRVPLPVAIFLRLAAHFLLEVPFIVASSLTFHLLPLIELF